MGTTSSIFTGRPVDAPALRLFLIHHAGGSHMAYRPLAEAFPPEWEICMIEAPGRGRLLDEPPVDDPRALVDRLFEDLLVWLDRPFAFFGHSMGGILAHDLTLRLATEGLPLPHWLGLSARGAPHPDGSLGPERRHLLPSPELREELGAFGGTPDSVLNDDSLWSMVEPVLRADLRVIETWRASVDTQLPDVPLSVFGGEEDPLVTPAGLAGWADRAPAFLGLHMFPGHHFYLIGRTAEVAERITGDIRKALAARGR